jgi:polyferredoxin
MLAKINTPDAKSRYRMGTALVWVGVLAWVPFILLWVFGQKPSLAWFLPFHLLGVVGGARLRSHARRLLGFSPPKKNVFRTVGRVLILAGILTWLPYFYLKLIALVPIEATDFLPFHLSGIFGGLAFTMIGRGKKRSAKA